MREVVIQRPGTSHVMSKMVFDLGGSGDSGFPLAGPIRPLSSNCRPHPLPFLALGQAGWTRQGWRAETDYTVCM